MLPSTSVSLWCYVFYVSKYYELLDTLFLLLKGKTPRPVQTVHHTSVLLLFWAFENARMTNHWFLVFANSFVHVFVYGYFVCSTLGITVPFKPYITLLQISQFVADIAYAFIFPVCKQLGWTHGDWGPVLLGYAVGLVFIVLFYDVYKSIKRQQRQQHAAQGGAPTNGRKTKRQ